MKNTFQHDDAYKHARPYVVYMCVYLRISVYKIFDFSGFISFKGAGGSIFY